VRRRTRIRGVAIAIVAVAVAVAVAAPATAAGTVGGLTGQQRALADRLLAPMNFSIFYDARPQTDCNTNASLPGNPPGPAVRWLLR
jgi:hypothetical protein